MELRHLRYFVAVAEAENVSRAALKLHVSQPAVSTQIRDLEDEIGFSLLERTAKSVKLTEAGRVFLDETRAVLQRADDAVTRARAVAHSEKTELHVGYSPTPTAHLLPTILRACQKVMPRVRIQLRDQSNDQNLADLRTGRLQVAFIVRGPGSTARPLRNLRFQPLAELQVRLAVSPDHPLARRRSVSWAEAAREPFVAYSRKDYPDYHAAVAAMFAQVKAKPRIVEEHEGFSSLIPAIEAGTGVAIVTDSFAYTAGKRVRLLRLEPEPEGSIIGIAAAKGDLNAATEQFWRCAIEAATSPGTGDADINNRAERHTLARSASTR